MHEYKKCEICKEEEPLYKCDNCGKNVCKECLGGEDHDQNSLCVECDY